MCLWVSPPYKRSKAAKVHALFFRVLTPCILVGSCQNLRAANYLCLPNTKCSTYNIPHNPSRLCLKCDGTRAETRFSLSGQKGRVHLNRPRGRQFSWLLAVEVCTSAVVMVVMLDTSCSEVECKITGYPLHSHVSPSLPLPCVTVCHHISTGVYQIYWGT